MEAGMYFIQVCGGPTTLIPGVPPHPHLGLLVVQTHHILMFILLTKTVQEAHGRPGCSCLYARGVERRVA